jgi:Succinylglutamate desuccinylase / Aspartoacylase family
MNAAPIGTPGKPWGDAEKVEWLARQTRKRSYDDDIVARVHRLASRFDVGEYGRLDYPPQSFPLYAIRSRGWSDARPIAIVTGGVHGYETSGVHGALQFAEQHMADYEGRLDVLVAPCVSPWAYERVHRWNPQAIDPNRAFREHSPAAESAALWQLLTALGNRVVVHVDLHETTDSDETEFRPALAARDGIALEPGEIPDGFYVVDDSARPQPKFQQAVIAAVAKITHIAPADRNNQIIGSPVVAPGVIEYALRELGLCAGITGATYKTTTEVYPDSARVTPDQCNAAQVAAVRAGLDFVLAS